MVQDGDSYYATATSATYTAPGVAGTYRWVAHFDGDANNVDADSPCNATGESTDVTKANPAIVTVAEATDDTLPGTSVKDTANLTGLSADAGGTVTFKLYSDNTCETLVTTLGPVAIGTVSDGKASATSPSYTGLGDAGTYWFIASYSGDDNNNPVAGECGDDNEDLTIKKANPAIVTVAEATDDTLPGTSVKDTANLTGLSADAGGSVTSSSTATTPARRL